MYITHSVHINRSVEDCSEALAGEPGKWFPRLGGKNVGRVEVHVAGVPIRKKVVVEVGQPVKTSSWASIPLNWKATFPEKLFPAMTGKVELAPVDQGVTKLTVSGMYEPPLGAVGRQIDEALMHGIAEATVKELADSIANRLNKAIASSRD